MLVNPLLTCCSLTTAATPVGYLCTFWNMPMFSWASTDPFLSDKKLYRTLVRIAPPFSKMGNAIYNAFLHFNWLNVIMVSQLRTGRSATHSDICIYIIKPL